MNKIMVYVLSILITISLCGCASQNKSPRYTACYGKTFNQLLESTDLKHLFNGIAGELCSDNPSLEDNSKNHPILITDFVDIQSFTPAPQGLLMGELMRSSLSSVCGKKITQVEFANFFNLNEKGLVVLSRNVSEIKKDEYDQTEAIVGTYSYLNNKIVLFARKINVVTGKISKMVTREVDYNCTGGNVGYNVK
ncbi:MAG: FlgO family outer membrane protein [Desulfuromonadaceae bacterium]|nr:FlgO family outer membrane protein [Desulfuromonadaceae bacterium]MDD2853905.1 FlgO family outer membrane protein [Desulfuromonadaceae bacterium]